MQKIINRTFMVLAAVVFIAKISAWFADYSEETKYFISTAMFVVIGAYVFTTGLYLTKLLQKSIFMICGTFLIAYKFLPEMIIIPYIAIVCMIVPFVIGRYFPDDEISDEVIFKK